MTIKNQLTSQIKYLTIHCAATPEGRDNSADEVRKWDIDRFGQPSYHFVVELDGDFFRHLKDTQIGAHVAGHNTGNIGVCYIGGTETLNEGGDPKDTRTPAQKRALRTLVRMYRQNYPGITVKGHNEWPGVTKACPSFSVTAWLKAGMPE